MKLRTLRLAFARVPPVPTMRLLFSPPTPPTAINDPQADRMDTPGHAAMPINMRTLDIRIAPSTSRDTLSTASLASIPDNVHILRLALLQLQPLPQTINSSTGSTPLFEPSSTGSWRSAASTLRESRATLQWQTQETELVALLTHTNKLPLLERLEIVTPFQPFRRSSSYSRERGGFSSSLDGSDAEGEEEEDEEGGYRWVDLRAACNKRGVALVLRTELMC